MSEVNVYESVKQVIVERLGVDESKITKDTSFRDDLGADSLDVVELVMEMEDRFNIEVSDDDAEQLNTVGKVAEFIEKNVDPSELN